MRPSAIAIPCALSLGACNLLFEHDAGRYVPGVGPVSDGAIADASVVDAEDTGAVADSTPSPCTADAMSDPDNCGSCGHSCLGGDCAGGACQPVAIADGAHPVVNGIWSLAIDGPTAFFTSWCSTAPLFSVPVDGGTVSQLAPGNGFATCGNGLALDPEQVFFGSIDYASNVGSIQSVPRSGGTPTTIVAGLAGRPFFAIDASQVYYLLTWSHVPGVFRIGRDGKDPTMVHPASSVALAIDARSLYVAETGGAIMRMAKDGSSTVVLASSNKPAFLTVDATSAYWSDSSENAVYGVPLAGGAVARLGVGMLPSPNELAVDDRSVYAACSNGVVAAVDKDGTHLRVVASQSGLTISGIAVDDRFVYWGDDDTPSRLWRVAK
jgi:hypothetical protein